MCAEKIMERIPHKLNAPGDFYVEDGCCTACDLPSSEAPGFFEYEITDNEYHPGSKSYHCYLCKQPKDSEEVKLILDAMQVQELDCIRYKGNEPQILKLMEQEGIPEYSDVLEPSLPNIEAPKSLIQKLLGLFK